MSVEDAAARSRAVVVCALLAMAAAPRDAAARHEEPVGGSGGPAPTTGQLELRKLEKELAEAKVEQAEYKANAAQKQAEEAKTEKKAAEVDAAAVRAGKIIQYGVTAGVAPVFHVPLHRGARKQGPAPGFGAMPYVMFHPEYWRPRPQTNIYCANRYGGESSESAAQVAADGSAFERASRRLEVLLAAVTVTPTLTTKRLSVPSNRTEAKVVDLLAYMHQNAKAGGYSDKELETAKGELDRRLRDRRVSNEFRKAVLALLAEATPTAYMGALDKAAAVKFHDWPYRELAGLREEHLSFAKRIVFADGASIEVQEGTVKVTITVEEAKRRLTLLLQSTVVGWASDLRPSCALHHIGFWFGYPLPFKVTVPSLFGADGDERTVRTRVRVKDIFAAGLGVSPNAYVSILTGVAVGLTNLPDPPGIGDADNEVVWTWLFGLGGNADIFTLLRK